MPLCAAPFTPSILDEPQFITQNTMLPMQSLSCQFKNPLSFHLNTLLFCRILEFSLMNPNNIIQYSWYILHKPIIFAWGKNPDDYQKISKVIYCIDVSVVTDC